MTYDCAYCPLGGVGEPVIVDGYPAHPECADAIDGMTYDQLYEIREEIMSEPIYYCPLCMSY